MCGIAGVFYFDGRRPQSNTLRRMGDSIAHRGPDAEGYFNDGPVGLVHRRLSIIDLEGGDQPIFNEDNSIVIVFNGEVYNYRKLKGLLKQRGHQFQTASDTECLVHLYEDYGQRLVELLSGMFAFAIWDSRKSTLTLGRDHLGQKPLYYYRDKEKFVFGSELRAILTHPNVPNQLDARAVDSFLSLGMIPDPTTVYNNVHKVPPGCVAQVSRNGHFELSRYWEYSPAANLERTEGEWLEAVRSLVESTVASHLVSDVAVGSFLSGGIDSTIVSSIAAASCDEKLQTFSIGFGNRNSELSLARTTSARIGSEHREAVVSPDAAADLDKLVEVYDEPFGDSSAIPTMKVSELAARHVKVVLSGDGGDECFGGYSRYIRDIAESRFRRHLPAWVRRHILRQLAWAWPTATWLPRALRAKSFLTNTSSPPSLAYAQTISMCSSQLRKHLYTPQMLAMLDGWCVEEHLAESFHIDDDDPLSGMLAADFQCLLPGAFLTKVDRASMAYGLEVRPPFVDHTLVEMCGQIPSHFKIQGRETKWLLKRAMSRLLPESLLSQPKQGFEIPLDEWMRGSLREVFHERVFASGHPITDFFREARLRQLLDGHVRGTRRCGQVLWNILVFASWLDRYRPSLPV